MNIKYKDKEYEAKFNIKFMMNLDKKIQGEFWGQQIGLSLPDAINGLEDRDVLTLVDVLDSAIKELKENQVIEAIEQYGEEHGDIEVLYETVLDEMGESSVLKPTIRKEKEEENNPEKQQIKEALLKNLEK